MKTKICKCGNPITNQNRIYCSATCKMIFTIAPKLKWLRNQKLSIEQLKDWYAKSYPRKLIKKKNTFN